MARQAARQQELGDKVRNRHTAESGVIEVIAINSAGTWYHITTPRGMSVGWWHETDLDATPRSVPPSQKSAD